MEPEGLRLPLSSRGPVGNEEGEEAWLDPQGEEVSHSPFEKRQTLAAPHFQLANSNPQVSEEIREKPWSTPCSTALKEEPEFRCNPKKGRG